MPIPKPTFTPPFNIVRCSHTEWGVTDMDYARDFYIDLLGYICEDDLGDTLYLRGLEERNHHALILTKANSPSVCREGLCSRWVGELVDFRDAGRQCFFSIN